MLWAAMIFTTVTTLLRHLARAQKPDEKKTCGCTILKISGEKRHRGYYTVARRYEFYFRVAKQYFTNERSE